MITPIKKSIIIISTIIVLFGSVLLGCKNDNNKGSTSNNTTSHIPVSEENTAEGYGLEEDEDDNSYESDDNSSKNNSGDNKNNLNSYCLALAGLDILDSGNVSSEILPLYLKKPQAQRQLEEKQKNSERI